MDVIERYLRTLRLFLPKSQRDDIIRELSEEIRSQVEEQEAALGRSLEESERAAILGQYGHPMRMAARYRPQGHLIGPVVFPYYWMVLKATLALVGIGHLAGIGVLLAGGASMLQVGEAVEKAITTALQIAAWLTALGAVADFSLSRSRALEKWTPPINSSPLPPHARHAIVTARATDPSISGLVIGVVAGVWWLAGLRFPYLFFGSGAANLEWGPAMDRLYPVLVIAQVTMLAQQFIRYTRPENTGFFRVARFVWLVAGVALIYLVATSDHQWMVWRADSASGGNATILRFAGRTMPAIEFVNKAWSMVLIGVAAASAWGFLSALLRRFRGAPLRAHVAGVLTAVSWTLTASLSGQTAPSPSHAPLSDAQIRAILVETSRRWPATPSSSLRSSPRAPAPSSRWRVRATR